jgi:hypothetical protein
MDKPLLENRHCGGKMHRFLQLQDTGFFIEAALFPVP